MTTTLFPPTQPTLTRLGITPEIVRRMAPGFRRTQCRAIINWLTRHRPKQTDNNLEQIKGYLEAFHHLCDMQEWERAFSLISTRLNTPTQEHLHYQLKFWGYSQLRTELYKRLAERNNHTTPDGWSARMLQFLGESYYSQNRYTEAQHYYEQSLALFRQLAKAEGNKTEETEDVGFLLSALGEIFYVQGVYEKAIDYQQQALDIAQSQHNASRSDSQSKYAQSSLFAQGIALGSLGNLYEAKGDYDRAKDYHQQHLAIAEEIQDSEMKGAAIGNLGSCYYALNQHKQAKDCHQRHLEIAEEIGNQQGKSNALGGLGSVCYRLGDYASAAKYFEAQRAIAKEISDKLSEANALGALGNVSFSQGDYSKAEDYHRQHLEIAQMIEHSKSLLHALGDLGNVSLATGDYATARDYYIRQLTLARQIGDRLAEAVASGNLGVIAYELGHYKAALRLMTRQLEIVRSLKDRARESQALSNLGNVYRAIGESLQAESCYQTARAITRPLLNHQTDRSSN